MAVFAAAFVLSSPLRAAAAYRMLRTTRGACTDRTAELFAIADARCKLRGYAPTPRARTPKSQFGNMASRIGRALAEVEGRTDRLARLSTKSSLFDDPGAEIAEITTLLKQELASIGASIEALHSCKPAGRQMAPHAEAVLGWLQGNFAQGTERFQSALQQREAVLNNKEARLAGISAASMPQPATPQAPALYQPATPQAPASGRAGRSNLLQQAELRRQQAGELVVVEEHVVLHQAHRLPPASRRVTLRRRGVAQTESAQLHGSERHVDDPRTRQCPRCVTGYSKPRLG